MPKLSPFLLHSSADVLWRGGPVFSVLTHPGARSDPGAGRARGDLLHPEGCTRRRFCVALTVPARPLGAPSLAPVPGNQPVFSEPFSHSGPTGYVLCGALKSTPSSGSPG